MVFPLSYTAVLLVALASFVLGTLWALTPRAAGKWRFELFGVDFGLGAVLAALCLGFTLGALGEEITFYDNLMIMRKSSLLFLVGFGALLNLGMLLLLGAIALTGVASTFLIGLGMAAVTGAIGMHIFQPIMSPLFLGLGCLLLLVAVGAAANAHSTRVRQRDTDLLQKAVAAGLKGKIPRTSPAKGLVLAIAGGLLTGLAQPIALWTQSRDEIGFGAYSMGALFAAAFVVGTPFFSLFFLNLPVQGEALSFGAWLRSPVKRHLMGLAGGAIWYASLLAMLLAVSATPAAGFSRTLAFTICRASLVVGAAIGIFQLGEFAGSPAARKQAAIALLAATAGLVVFLVSRP